MKRDGRRGAGVVGIMVVLASCEANVAEVDFDAPWSLLPDPVEPQARVRTANVRVSDDGDSIYVAESLEGRVVRLPECRDGCRQPQVAADLGTPVRTHPVDFDLDGDEDVVVADIGNLYSLNTMAGRVLLLERGSDGAMNTRVLVEGLDRIASAEAADLDGDGDFDLLVGIYGHHTRGALVWFEQTSPWAFTEHVLDPRSGTIHAFADDIDGDDDADVVTVLAEEHEEVNAFVNDGHGGFSRRNLFTADAACHGLSGLELVDLDQDGDQDLLVTTGDTFDRHCISPKFTRGHGLGWFESDGRGGYRHHPIFSVYAAYSVRAADFDGDGDLDLALSSHYDPADKPDSVPRGQIHWLRNDGDQNFEPHGLAEAAFPAVTIEIADIDGNGVPDILTGSMELESAATGGRRLSVLFGHRG